VILKALYLPSSSSIPVFQVKDSVCLVTGSAQGLGKAFAVRLLQAGARFVIEDYRGASVSKILEEEDKIGYQSQGC
jgi:glucose 1-dehydrogenase